jgi:hypothetical protein
VPESAQYQLPDVVLSVCARKHIDTWRSAAAAQLRFLAAKDRLVIVPRPDYQAFRDVTPRCIRVEPEDEYLSEFGPALRHAIETAGTTHRYGWYLQQYLKLEAIRRLSREQRAVIWDADTVLLKPVHFFDAEGNPLFFPATEHHIPYFTTISRAFGLDKSVQPSFVAQCIPVPSGLPARFFAGLEASGESWFRRLISATDFREQSGFSEYETLGTFFAAESGSITWQTDGWIRDGWRYFDSPEDALQHPQRRHARPAAFVAFEDWLVPERSTFESRGHRNRLVRRGRKLFFGALGRIFVLKSLGRKFGALLSAGKSKSPSDFLEQLFHLQGGIRVIQIGACKGLAHDPLRKFLAYPGNYVADLYEPIPEYWTQLFSLYASRPDVRLHNMAVLDQPQTLKLHYIAPDIADQMDGDGPLNRWAYGQRSISREVVVYWIYKNAFRGQQYEARIPEWIENITTCEIPCTGIVDVLGAVEEGPPCLLVLDVQGSEEAILAAIESERLPAWVYVETDRGSGAIHARLEALGYRREISGSDSCFSLPGHEVFGSGGAR